MNQPEFGGPGPKPSTTGVGTLPARPVGVHGQTPATQNGGVTPQEKRSMPSAGPNGMHTGRLTTGVSGQGFIPKSGPQ